MPSSLFQQAASPTLRMLICVVLSLVMMTFDPRSHYLTPVRNTINYLVSPLYYLVDAPFALFSWAGEYVQTHNALVEDNRRLKEVNLTLQTRQQKLEILQEENNRLRILLRSTPKTIEHSLVAELLMVSLDPYRHQIVINKGRQQGVYSGQPLISATGVMGQVIHAGYANSHALLISDPSHAIPVQANRSGLRAIAQGTGSADELKLLYIPNNADIREGDLIVSSGLGGRFPSHYPVATVTAVVLNPGQPFATVTAVPTAALDRTREVLLVWPDNKGRKVTYD